MKFNLLLLIGMILAAHAVPMFNPPTPPIKYGKNSNGVTKKTDAYIEWEKSQGISTPSKFAPMKNEREALGVVSSMEEYEAYNLNSNKEHRLSESTSESFEMLQDPEISQPIGLPSDRIIDELGKVFSKYEVPLGLLNKLMELQNYHLLEFIIDDSGSMNSLSDTKDVNGRQETRWQEAISRMKSLIEILAYVPTPPIVIRFLNRKNIVRVKHNGEAPTAFILNTVKLLEEATSVLPTRYDTTPALEVLTQSFNEGVGKNVVRYFFGDGVPNGARLAQRKIKELVIKRANPENNPLTFFSCTNEDDDVEWMKETEEVAKFCAELDDYSDESDEVLKDQGVALPFTRGFYLVASLVAAMNPDDLDAMDESVPLTKTTLDNLLGIEQSTENYKYYFDEFLIAQRKREVKTRADRIKQQMNWAPWYNSFLTAGIAKNIPAVATFKQQLEAADPQYGHQQTHGQPYYGQGQQSY